MGTTLAKSTLEVSATVPADTSDAILFAALVWVPGSCALHTVPPVGYSYDAVQEDLVCDEITKSVKGGAKYDDVTFMLSKLPGDLMQAELQTLLDSQNAVGSFKLTLTDSTVIYFTGQVAKMSLTEGGGKNDINKRSVQVFVHSKPIEEAI